MAKKEFAPVTPGEMLRDEFMTEHGLSNQLAKAVSISPNRIAEIVNNPASYRSEETLDEFRAGCCLSCIVSSRPSLTQAGISDKRRCVHRLGLE